MTYVPPEYSRDAFNCPNCDVFSHQVWMDDLMGFVREGDHKRGRSLPDGYAVSHCDYCNGLTLWFDGNIVFSNSTTAPLPHNDMPDEIVKDFNEARQVFSISPRSSAALLRLAIQKLCKYFGYSGENINADIGKMVANGLDTLVQQAFDSVRVIGNEAVHPGQIDLRDNPDTALQLFNLVNFIVEEMITKPKRIREIYNKLPRGKLQQIEQRDKSSKPAIDS